MSIRWQIGATSVDLALGMNGDSVEKLLHQVHVALTAATVGRSAQACATPPLTADAGVVITSEARTEVGNES